MRDPRHLFTDFASRGSGGSLKCGKVWVSKRSCYRGAAVAALGVLALCYFSGFISPRLFSRLKSLPWVKRLVPREQVLGNAVLLGFSHVRELRQSIVRVEAGSRNRVKEADVWVTIDPAKDSLKNEDLSRLASSIKGRLYLVPVLTSLHPTATSTAEP